MLFNCRGSLILEGNRVRCSRVAATFVFGIGGLKESLCVYCTKEISF